MSNSYVLGRGRENNLIVKLRKKGWFAIRGSGSKAGMVIVEGKKYFPIDIVAVIGAGSPIVTERVSAQVPSVAITV